MLCYGNLGILMIFFSTLNDYTAYIFNDIKKQALGAHALIYLGFSLIYI